VLVNGFFAVANNVFAPRDTIIAEDMSRPQVPERSGSPQSLSSWDLLGRQGRYFVGGGPTVAEIDAASGGGAKEPIRVYAGLRSADTVQGRADLVLEELKRTGGFDRKVLVVATVRETSRVVFGTVHAYWSTLPEASRPKLYLYGLSLGSLGVESILSSINVINEPVDGALMSGPPFANDLHARLTAQRDPGSPAYLPVYERGRTVRFTSQENGLDRGGSTWGPTRLVYLQHASDPIVFFSPSLAFTAPEWLANGDRGSDVSASMGWFPLVTMWQVLLDLPSAGSIPMGYGHLYSATSNLESWVAVTDPAGWTPEKTAALSSILEVRPYKNT
jgi:uncharacterized membrane protein